MEIMLLIRLAAQWLSHFIQMKSQSPKDGLQRPPCAEFPYFPDLRLGALPPCSLGHKPAFFLSKALVAFKILYLTC